MTVTPARYTVTTTVLAVQVTVANPVDVVAWLTSLGVRAWVAARAVGVMFTPAAGLGAVVTAVPGDWVTFSTVQGAAKVAANVFAAGYRAAS